MLSRRQSFPLASTRCSPISNGSGSTPDKETGDVKNTASGPPTGTKCSSRLGNLTVKQVRVVDALPQVHQDVQQPVLAAQLVSKSL